MSPGHGYSFSSRISDSFIPFRLKAVFVALNFGFFEAEEWPQSHLSFKDDSDLISEKRLLDMGKLEAEGCEGKMLAFLGERIEV